jgi:hypothetical protein
MKRYVLCEVRISHRGADEHFKCSGDDVQVIYITKDWKRLLPACAE